MSTKPKAKNPSPSQQIALVLQGGGALGAYQAGVHEVLLNQGNRIDWVIGTSIGAINAAIIAGNPPAKQAEKLKEFWDIVSSESVGGYSAPWLQSWMGQSQVMKTITQGIPGFFVPRSVWAWDINLPVSTAQTSFYDTSPLKETLLKVVDFDYLNSGTTRCSVCAVSVASSELTIFDNAKEPLTPEHIMASGALPPGFAPVVINKVAYWDGGIYSNSPIEVVLNDSLTKDTLCYMIDLWDPTVEEPRSIAQAMARLKDIQYASRSKEHLIAHKKLQDLRCAIELLAAQLPATALKNTAVQKAVALGDSHSINIVRLIMKALTSDDQSKDIDFSRAAIEARWQAGCQDAKRALLHKQWLKPLQEGVGMAIHELEQE